MRTRTRSKIKKVVVERVEVIFFYVLDQIVMDGMEVKKKEA